MSKLGASREKGKKGVLEKGQVGKEQDMRAQGVLWKPWGVWYKQSEVHRGSEGEMAENVDQMLCC